MKAVKRYECEECGKVFDSPGAAQNHESECVVEDDQVNEVFLHRNKLDDDYTFTRDLMEMLCSFTSDTCGECDECPLALEKANSFRKFLRRGKIRNFTLFANKVRDLAREIPVGADG